ncbi:phosphoribosylanthranilate isomerase [Kroppenstedtia sanguinis]|uniref:N-(5'-phosphoribosyl)anthranilate isomerase n=1 Tax=Kroppenstedtia sanguinis TaxID=1380684 RepID=A0ABW4CBL7_9BACL
MSPTFVKVCGLRSPEDAEKLEGLDVTAAGLIFVPGRHRQVTPEEGAAIAAHLPRGVLKAGVFINPTQKELLSVLDQVPLDLIQLHGEESPQFCEWLKEQGQVHVVKVFHMGESLPVSWEEYAPYIDAVLLDSSTGQKRGGTGKSFPWQWIPNEKKRWRRWELPVWVAGGLSPDNVERLLQEYAPDGVDVSGGVEMKGGKDRNKISQFVERVRQYDRQNH